MPGATNNRLPRHQEEVGKKIPIDTLYEVLSTKQTTRQKACTTPTKTPAKRPPEKENNCLKRIPRAQQIECGVHYINGGGAVAMVAAARRLLLRCASHSVAKTADVNMVAWWWCVLCLSW